MEKFKILLVALFISFSAIGQQYTPMTAAGYQMKRIKSDSTLHIPSFCGVPTLRNSTAKEGALAMDTCAGLLYMWTRSNGWDTVNTQGTTIDTTSLSNRINQKLSKSDSLIYYTKYRSDSSRTNIYTAIGNKLNTSDSSVYYTKYRSDTSRDNIYAAIYSATTGDTAIVVKAFVTNAESTTLTKGEVVYLYQASGNRASVKRANNKSDGTSAKTFGIVRDDIGANQTGYIVTQGQCDKLNLAAYPEGSTLYLDSISGQMTVTKPKAPYHLVYVGIVERANNGNGILYVKPQNGYELDEIHDVQINNPLNNQIIAYSDTQNIWKNRNIYSIVDTTSLSNRINTKLNSTDTASLSNRINTKLNSTDTASLSNRINTKLNSTDTASLSNRINTKLNSTDTASLSNRINSKLNSADSTIYQTKFRSDSARTNTYTSLNLKLNASDSATYYTKFRSDSSRTNIYTSIAGKFTLPSLTSGSVLFSNGTTIAQKNANLYWDNTNNRLGIGTNAPTTLFQTTQSNTDYTNTNGAGSHIYMTNPATLNGQNVVASFINGAMVAKWRTDSQGNISWVAGSTGSHNFYTKGDFSTGQIQMQIFNGGNVQIASSPVGGQNSDAGFKLDVQGTFKSTGRYTAYVSKTSAYTATTTDEVISADATSAAFQITLPTAVSKTGQVYTIKRANAGVNAVTVGTTSSQTIDGSTTYSLIAQYKYVSVVSNGANWLIIANN